MIFFNYWSCCPCSLWWSFASEIFSVQAPVLVFVLLKIFRLCWIISLDMSPKMSAILIKSDMNIWLVCSLRVYCVTHICVTPCLVVQNWARKLELWNLDPKSGVWSGMEIGLRIRPEFPEPLPNSVNSVARFQPHRFRNCLETKCTPSSWVDSSYAIHFIGIVLNTPLLAKMVLERHFARFK
jgi:hypothetical protein